MHCQGALTWYIIIPNLGTERLDATKFQWNIIGMSWPGCQKSTLWLNFGPLTKLISLCSVTMNEEDRCKLTVAQLRKELKSRQLETNGKRAELVERLRKYNEGTMLQYCRDLSLTLSTSQYFRLLLQEVNMSKPTNIVWTSEKRKTKKSNQWQCDHYILCFYYLENASTTGDDDDVGTVQEITENQDESRIELTRLKTQIVGIQYYRGEVSISCQAIIF